MEATCGENCRLRSYLEGLPATGASERPSPVKRWLFLGSGARIISEGFQTDLVIDCFSQALLAAQVALSGLNANVSQ